MKKNFVIAFALIQLLLVSSAIAGQSQYYKCNVNGSIQYQQSPCQSNEASKPPTVDELNAERLKQLTQERESPASPKLQARPLASPEAVNKERKNPPSSQRSSFNCDGRKFCSQMTSCTEAKYFLSNCPGVKMDGDGDGVPCEEQWCSR